jgi:hypothetical protein
MRNTLLEFTMNNQEKKEGLLLYYVFCVEEYGTASKGYN